MILDYTPAGVGSGAAESVRLYVHGSNLWLEGEDPEDETWLSLEREGYEPYTGLVRLEDGDLTDAWVARSWNLSAAEPGYWDVVVTRSDGQRAVAPGGFEVQAGPAVRMREVAVWGGQVNDVFVDPNEPDIAYVAAGRRLVVLDVADPADVIELGSVVLNRMVWCVAVRDGYAFVGTQSSTRPSRESFQVVDVHDPTAPRIIWTDTVTSVAKVHRIALYEDWAYVQDSDAGGIYAFNISDPENVSYTGNTRVAMSYDHVIRGDLLYTAAEGSDWIRPGLMIYDLAANPLRPPLVGSVEFEYPPAGGHPKAIDVEGDYAYVVTQGGSTGIQPVCVVNVADPEAPFVASYYTGLQGSYDVSVRDGYAYVADWLNDWDAAQGLAILDVATNPANPTLVATHKTHGAVWRVEVFGDRAYVMDSGEGLIILDISNPYDPIRLGGDTGRGNWHSPAFLRQLDQVGDRLYVTDEWNGFTILDVADPGDPTVVGVYQTPETGMHYCHWGIQVRDNLAYFSAGWDGLQVVDVGDPAAPSKLDGLPISGLAATGLMLSPTDPGVAHVGFGPYGFLVNFDVSDSYHIGMLGYVGVDAWVYTVDTAPAGAAFLAQWSGTGGALTSVDTSVAATPFVLGQRSGGVDLVRAGELVYVANAEPDIYKWDMKPAGGLHVFDVRDPAAPVELGFLGSRNATAVDVQHDVVYVMASPPSHGQSLLTLDVSDPTAPVLLAYTPVPVDGNAGPDVLVDGRTVYVTAGDMYSSDANGLAILDVGIPGDADGDWDVDLHDFAAFQRCFGAGVPGTGVPFTVGCLFADFDEDDDVDLDDLAAFAAAMVGCNPPGGDSTGACCLPDGTCRDNVTEPDCTWRLGGIYQGDGVTCDNVTCPPTGACCLPYGSIICEQYTEDACLRHGGTWYGEGSDCATTGCGGACCDPETGLCTDTRQPACEAGGGVYQGDGTTCAETVCDPVGACCAPSGECLMRTAFGCSELGGEYYGDGSDCETVVCPYAVYRNEIDTVTSFLPAGSSLAFADDLTMTGDPAARDLEYMSCAVYGNGGGSFDVTVSLYTACPGDGGTLIPGTTFTWPPVPDDGYYYETYVDIYPPVTLPSDSVWMHVTFSTPEAGWIIAEEAETGFTDDLFGSNDPPWECNYIFTNHDPYAGFWANLRCVVGDTKSAAGRGEPVLRIEQIEAPATLQPIEVREQRAIGRALKTEN